MFAVYFSQCSSISLGLSVVYVRACGFTGIGEIPLKVIVATFPWNDDKMVTAGKDLMSSTGARDVGMQELKLFYVCARNKNISLSDCCWTHSPVA